jgi:hypothetical protein
MRCSIIGAAALTRQDAPSGTPIVAAACDRRRDVQFLRLLTSARVESLRTFRGLFAD